ncbi:MAG: beta-ketoacyl synthase N-terminal-like domain-containing protein [Rhodospirillaceae bacterium]|nr:beta-ketoacyl synthase N-terminal-like domain-containing protein [Rhodospirillaceae bacterium]MDE0616478.1 beta-ketoacyl synthase N-terminal-like domain-containing protein [Rhodospirillaceae bacterium]
MTPEGDGRGDGRGDDPIAVVGMACRFPGAENLDAF